MVAPLPVATTPSTCLRSSRTLPSYLSHGSSPGAQCLRQWSGDKTPKNTGQRRKELCAARSPVQDIRALQSKLIEAASRLPTANLSITDRRPCLSHKRSLHRAPARKDYLPNHNLCRPLPPDIRSQARTQPRLHHTAPDARGYFCDTGMEEGCIRRLVWTKEQL